MNKDAAARIAFVQSCTDKEDEQRNKFNCDYDEKHVRQAIVHTRQDLWLVVYDLGTIKSYLRTTVFCLWIIIALLAYKIL